MGVDVVPDVRRVRDQLGLTQEDFATRFGFSVAAVRDGEQGRNMPSASARILLKVIAWAPEVVEAALAA